MTPSNDTATTATPSRRERLERPLAHVAVSALTAILALWLLLFAATASVAAAAVTGAPGAGIEQQGSGHVNAVAHTSAAEEAEGEEAGAEETEAEAEAASAEAEAEEEGEAAAAGSPSAGSSGTDAVVLSKLKLTTQAGTALRHHEPTASAVGFSFTLSASTKVHITLVKQTHAQGHTRWVTLPNSLTLTAARGQDHTSLKGHNRLSPGRYRLTVKPSGGRSRSIYLSALP